MDERSMAIELRSISCKGVKLLFNLFQKPCLYAIVSVAAPPDRKQIRQQHKKKKTPVDRHGGENPEWDQPILLDGVDPSLAIEFELKARRILGDSTVGRVRIPVADLDFTDASVKHASYQVRGPDGRPNGVLSLFYKIDGPHVADAVKPVPLIFNHEAVEYPAVWDNYPPPPAAEQYYPPPPPPQSVPAFGYYPLPPTDPAASFPPRDYEHHGWSAQPPPAYAGYYPSPPPPRGYYPPQAAPACCYSGPPPGYYPPQAAPACCYSGPLDAHGCRTEGWDHRGLHY